MDSAADLLRELDRRGWRVVLVTSAKDAELDALRRAAADDAITATASSDDVSEGKPAPDPVHHALGLADAPAHGAVLVGDAVWDMQAGFRADARVRGPALRWHPAACLEKAGARAVYRRPADLLAHIDSSPFADRDRPPNHTA
ncbi:HAD-IA family hydrolase [Streptomyces sp. NPDC051364]|uniref:HAD family hydrolase n=1 Tax=Streptomyces sp. NPDC051364 TaxID=3155799 RepID=UPI00341FF331